MSLLHRAILVSVASGGLGAFACTDESLGCRSNADCAAHELCNLLAGVCVEDLSKIAVTEGRFQGHFSCRLAADLASTTLEGTSSIVGQLGGARLRLDGGAVCVARALEGDNPHVDIAIFGRNRNAEGNVEEMQLGLELLQGELGGPAQFATAEDPLATGPMTPGTTRVLLSSIPIVGADPRGEVRLLAAGTGGTLEVSGSGHVDDFLRGHVAMDFTSFGGAGLGKACGSDADCAASHGMACLGGFCTSPCEADVDCAPEGVCFMPPEKQSGLCHVECRAAADCETGQRCYDAGGGRQVCALDGLYVLPGDSNHLGAPCPNGDECGLDACATFAGGSICTATCTDDADCAFYLGVAKACTPLGSQDALCLPTCTTTCADGLECVNVDRGSVCMPPSTPTLDVDSYAIARPAFRWAVR